jgi:hypothetical protein
VRVDCVHHRAATFTRSPRVIVQRLCHDQISTTRGVRTGRGCATARPRAVPRPHHMQESVNILHCLGEPRTQIQDCLGFRRGLTRGGFPPFAAVRTRPMPGRPRRGVLAQNRWDRRRHVHVDKSRGAEPDCVGHGDRQFIVPCSAVLMGKDA